MTQPIQDSLGPHPDFPDSHVAFDHDLGFYRTFPYPTDESLERFYTQEYREIRQESPDENYLRFMRHRARAQADYIISQSNHIVFNNIIDIGCGCGELLNALQPYAKNLYGYETDEAMAFHAEKNKKTDSINIYNSHFIPQQTHIKYDLLTMSHVLEHIPEPVKFMNLIRKESISNSGYIFIEVPNVPDFWAEKQISWRIKGLGHVNYFTPSSLKSVLIKSGFSVISVKESGMKIKKNIENMNPQKNIWTRIKNKISRKLALPSPLPAYHLHGGIHQRIYIQIIAKREK